MQVRSLKYTVLAQGRIDRPHLSANGTAAAWTQDVDGQQDVFVYSSLSAKSERRTHTSENEGFALVSDDAATLAFTRRSSTTNVWQLHLWREGREAPLDSGDHHVQSASMAADGQRLAWENHGRIDEANPTTVLADAHLPRPLHGDHDARQLKPQLSGDGRTLLYQISDLDSAESHLVVEGDLQPPLEIDNNTDAPTALSFDGSKIVYPTTDEQGFHSLVVLNRATGLSMKVSDEKGADEAQPTVAANGDLVFQLTRYDDQANPVRSLVRKTAGGLTESIATDQEWEPSLPQLSADGKTLMWLATSRQDPERQELRLAQL